MIARRSYIEGTRRSTITQPILSTKGKRKLRRTETTKLREKQEKPALISPTEVINRLKLMFRYTAHTKYGIFEH